MGEMMLLRIDPLMNFRGTVCGRAIQFKFIAILRNLYLVTGKGSAAYGANALLIE
jgi:hypothetical protein